MNCLSFNEKWDASREKPDSSREKRGDGKLPVSGTVLEQALDLSCKRLCIKKKERSPSFLLLILPW